jgi:transcriptional regulator with XRE-family HTH domain
MNVGERLKERRESVNLTLGQVGAYEDVTAQYLSQLETGKRTPNVWALLKRLAGRYRTSADYLLGITDDPTPMRDKGELAPEARQLLSLFRQLAIPRQRDLVAIAETYIDLDQPEPDKLTLDRAVIKATSRMKDEPHIIGGKK